MEYITTKEASKKWGISPTRITILANEGRIPGAQCLGRRWLIPATATKPEEYKPNRATSAKKEDKNKNNFSFPLYHFRPDYSYIQESKLSKQQQELLQAETAVLECRFLDAYPLLESILQKPEDIATEIGCLWNVGICCIGLNKPEEFSKIYLRLQLLLSDDFTHRNDLVIILDTLRTYVETLGNVANNDKFSINVNEQCIPLMCVQNGYTSLTREIMKPGSTDINLLELNLRLLKNTSSIIAVEMMHIYLLGIYFLHQDLTNTKRHANELVQMVFESKLYFPLVTYFHYFNTVLSPILKKYPKDFQEHCHDLVSQYEQNSNAFSS